jgi:hypothetical protein
MMGSDYLIKLQPLFLSNDTIRRSIQDMAYDILSQVLDEVKTCPSSMFSIQLDKSTDVTHLAQLLFSSDIFTMIYKNSVFVVQTFGNYNDCNRYF